MPGDLQEGIFHASGARPGKFFSVFFLRARSDLNAPQIGNALRVVWDMLEGLKTGTVSDLPGQPVPAGGLSVLLGYGLNAFSIPEARKPVPSDLRNFGRFRSPLPTGGGPLLIGSGLKYADGISANPATEDFVVQLIADTQLAVYRGIVEIWKVLSDMADPETSTSPLLLTGFFTGFQRDDNRSWIDFHDGISNMASADRAGAISVKITNVPEDKWTENGTYLAFIRTAVNLTAWRKLNRRQQEMLVGRDKLSGCPFQRLDAQGSPVAQTGCPMGGTINIGEAGNEAFREPRTAADADLRHSHVQRANHHIGPTSDPNSLRIFRQGYEFLESISEAPGFRVGLNFVSFQDTPQRLLRMLTQETWLGRVNFGGDPAVQLPNMNSFLTVHAAGIYVVPPVIVGEIFPGSSIFMP